MFKLFENYTKTILTGAGVVSFKELLGYNVSKDIALLYAIGLFKNVVKVADCTILLTTAKRNDAKAMINAQTYNRISINK